MHHIKFYSLGKFYILLLLSTSCLSVQKIDSSLEQPWIDIGVNEPLPKTKFPSISVPTGINIDSVFYPSGLAPHSFSHRTGIIIIPLLLYNRFQSNYLITLGSKQFAQPINEAFKERFRAMLTACEDSTNILRNDSYKLTMDLQSCQVQGIYVHGSWSAYILYGSLNGIIDHGRNASSFVRIRWELSQQDESVASGNVMVTLKDSYLAQPTGFLTTNGKRTELSSKDLNFGIPFQVKISNAPYLNSQHINQLVQVLCLSMDEASETILKDIQHYFREQGMSQGK